MSADASDPMSADMPASPISSAWRAFATRDRLSLTSGCVICLALTFWLAGILNVPASPGRAGILLQQPAWPIAIMAAWLSIFLGTAVSSIIASRVHYEGGLFCACIGLAGLSLRLGPVRFALFNSNGPQVLIWFALELVLLGVAIAAAWLLLHKMTQMGLLPHEPPSDEEDESLDQKLMAAAAQVVLTALIILLLCQTDDKHQVMAVVAIASYFGALGAHHFVMTRPSFWFWIGPLAVGIIGYLIESMAKSNWMIGELNGFFAGLARPMPIDYAGLGTAGALLGYWTSQRWHQAKALGDLD